MINVLPNSFLLFDHGMTNLNQCHVLYLLSKFNIFNKRVDGNVAPKNMFRGRPLRSRNKVNICVFPNEDLSTPLAVIEFIPKCKMHRRIFLQVFGNFGYISEFVRKNINSQSLS